MGTKSREGVSRRGPNGWLKLCLLLSVVYLLLSAWPLRSQQPPSAISVNVKVVNVLASVRTKHGETVCNLTQDDFVLEEDGRLQTIRYFARETDLPLTLGLLVDHSMSQRLRNQYSLAYTLDRADTGPSYHKIRLMTKQKDLLVQTRDGY